MNTTRPPLRTQTSTLASQAVPTSKRNSGNPPGSLLATDNRRKTSPGSIKSESASSYSQISDNVLINSQVFEPLLDNDESVKTESSREYSASFITDSNVISQIDSEEATPSPTNLTRSHTNQSSLEQDWIVFSPDQHDDVELNPVPTTGTITPLAFPAHNGTGSFLDQLNESVAAAAAAAAAATAASNSSLSSATMDRINAWRINQSQHILNEFTKLEMRNRRKSQSVKSGSTGTVDSTLSSWGLPEEEDDEDYMIHTHDEIARALSANFDASPSSSSYNSRSALAASIIADELAHIMGSGTPYETAVRLLLTAAENAHQVYQQDALDQALNAILDPSLSLNPTQTRSYSYTNSPEPTGSTTPTPTSIAKSSGDKETLWQYITTKVLYDFIGLTDEIMEVIMGERFIDPDATKSEKTSSNSISIPKNISQNISKGISECRQAGSYSEYGNYISTPSPLPSPPKSNAVASTQSYLQMLESTATMPGETSSQKLAREVSQELASVVRQRTRQTSSQPTSSTHHNSTQRRPKKSQGIATPSALALRDFLRSRLVTELGVGASQPGVADYVHHRLDKFSGVAVSEDDALSVASSGKRCAASGVCNADAQASIKAKRARRAKTGNVSASITSSSPSLTHDEAGNEEDQNPEANYWEMSSASGKNGSDSGHIIGVW